MAVKRHGTKWRADWRDEFGIRHRKDFDLKAAAENHIPCILELGGKSPQIVFEDVNFEKAADVTVNAIVQNAGQTCSAGSRVLIQRTVYEKFMTELSRRFNRLNPEALVFP